MPQWYTHNHEFGYVESLVLITIVFLELVFDVAWHAMAKPAGKSYKYGQLHEEAFQQHASTVLHEMSHVRLYKELLNKMGGEFMSLGFIAFSVFCANQLQFFEFVAAHVKGCTGDESGCIALPYKGVDWLHLIELVHVQLFVGMMLYFVVMFGLVRGSVRQIRIWESLRLRRISSDKLHRSFSQTLRNTTKDRDLQEYVCLREYLVVHVLRWRHTRPKLFQEIVEALGMANLPEEEETGYLVEDLVKTQLEANFAFSSYLALNVETAVRDSIELHAGTWITIIVIFSALALGCRFSELTILEVMPVIVSLALLIVCLIVVMTGLRHRSLAKLSKDWMSAALEKQVHRRTRVEQVSQESTAALDFEWEKYVMRFLQVFLFLISYTFSRTLVAFKDWRENFEFQMTVAAFFMVLFMLLLFVLPYYVPVFLELMALPPYIDKENLRKFFAVIDEGFATRFRQEGSSMLEKKRRNSQRSSEPTLGSLGSMASMNSMIPQKSGGKSDTDALRVISELVHVLQNCNTVEDFRALRSTLAANLPAGVELPVPADGLLNASY